MSDFLASWSLFWPSYLAGWVSAALHALIALATALVMMVLVPRSGAILAERTKAIRSDLANALIVERQFLHPMEGVTLFITDTNRGGEKTLRKLEARCKPAELPVRYVWWDAGQPEPVAQPGERLVICSWEDHPEPAESAAAAEPSR